MPGQSTPVSPFDDFRERIARWWAALLDATRRRLHHWTPGLVRVSPRRDNASDGTE